jgi:ubiquinone/menaquinone biosynthesis C-methylase UbiE
MNDNLVGLTMIGGRALSARLAITAAAVDPGDRVLDVGCGPGAAARRAARGGLLVTGVDPSEAMLRLGTRLTPRSLRPRLRFVQGYAEALPVPDATVDAAWALHSAHHWDAPLVAWRELRRVLVPGGRLVVIERLTQPGRRPHHAIPTETVDVYIAGIEAAGFAIPRLDLRGDANHLALITAIRND